MTVETVVATANIRDTLDQTAAGHALALVLEHHPDILALEEWPKGRDHLVKAAGLGQARPAQGGSPVTWRKDRFGLVSCHGHTLSRVELVGHLIGRKARLPKSIANVTVLHDDHTGFDVAVISFHLTAEVQFAGQYRTDLAHRLRVARHKRERRRLGRIVRRQLAKGRDPIPLGDTNFDGMELPPLISCWDGHPGGSLGGRAVDIVFATHPADRVETQPTASDHDAVIVTYRKES